MKLKKTILIFFVLIFSQMSHSLPMQARDSETRIQNDILMYINAYRKQKGLAPLKMDYRMVKEAKQHSQEMANHEIPFGHRYFMQRMHRLYAHIKDAGRGAENVAYHYKSAKDVVNNWLRSPGHKANIDGPYHLTGIGIAYDSQGKLYFTQLFLQQGKPYSSLNQS